MISREIIQKLKETYPVGTRVKLIQMEDDEAPPAGTLGTVYGVDAIGSILVKWDNGSMLNVIFREDLIEKIWINSHFIIVYCLTIPLLYGNMCTTKEEERKMKKIELLENIKEKEEFEENRISYRFYWAYRESQRIGRDIINFDDIGFENNHEDMIENLERFGIQEFTISDQSTGLMKGLKSFKRRDYFPEDIIEIDTGRTHWNFKENKEEKEYTPALLFKRN